MSEKRFVIYEKTNYKDYPIILDTKTGDWWVIQDTMMGTGKLLDLLNEMFEKLNKKQEKSVELFFKYKKLKEENRELRQSVEYWQKKYEEGTETFQIN